MTVIAFQGSPGAFSEDAALAVLGAYGGPDPEPMPCAQFDDVFDAVADGRAALGVVPVENTLAGSVQVAYDLLRDRKLALVSEHVERIAHCLLAPPGVRLTDLREVHSHPVALAQCRQFFAAHAPLRPVAVPDTAGAIESIMARPPGWTAAIASRRAARIYGARVLAEHLEDDPANFTRFLVLAPRPVADQPAGPGAYKTSLVVTLPHRPGALAEALRHFADRQIDLTMIESRPRPGRPFEYAFYLDLAGHVRDPIVADALESLRHGAHVDLLGSYPRGAWPASGAEESAT
jgi:prephenate dehydratase